MRAGGGERGRYAGLFLGRGWGGDAFKSSRASKPSPPPLRKAGSRPGDSLCAPHPPSMGGVRFVQALCRLVCCHGSMPISPLPSSSSPPMRASSNVVASSGCSPAGRPQPVRDAVAAYRNPDGGFGQALEPDGRCPGSQPPAVALALRSATRPTPGTRSSSPARATGSRPPLRPRAARRSWTRPSRAGRARRGGRCRRVCRPRWCRRA